jgi:Tfp pilus assembly protein PilF
MPASKNADANEYFERAVLLARYQADWIPARQMFEKALEAEPHFAEARRWHAFGLVFESNDTDLFYKAEEELRQAAQDEPNLASIHSALAVVYLHEGRKELIPAEREKSVKALPNDPEALNVAAQLPPAERTKHRSAGVGEVDDSA